MRVAVLVHGGSYGRDGAVIGIGGCRDSKGDGRCRWFWKKALHQCGHGVDGDDQHRQKQKNNAHAYQHQFNAATHQLCHIANPYPEMLETIEYLETMVTLSIKLLPETN